MTIGTLTLAIMAICFVTGHAIAADQGPQYSTQAPTITKLEALKTKIKAPSTKIYKCVEVELNDKVNLVNKRQQK